VLYLATVFATSAWARGRAAAGAKPLDLRAALIAHNLALCVGSAALFLMMAASLTTRWARVDGMHGFICSQELIKPGFLWVLYYANYMFKFYEFVDTLFMAARGKPTPFLHVYHHAATLLLVYVSITERLAVQWLPISINLFVHVVMYAYYGLSAMGIRVSWKKAVTALQIIQFVLDLIGIYYAVAYRMFYGKENCAGTDFGAAMGVGIISSYLLLFVDFYIQTYKKSKKRRAEARANGITNGKHSAVNGHSAAIANGTKGYTNGTNGHANGHAVNGHTNGHVSANGAAEPKKQI
jgi:fatty acid elongase 3